MKHPGFAPLLTLALAIVPPVLLFSLVCYLFDRWHVTRMSERRFLPMMMWMAFCIVLGNCVMLSFWAARRLRREFRTTVTSRYEPVPSRPWWRRITRRGIVRFAATGLAGVLILALLGVLIYGYQNWQSRRRWAAFQKELRQRGETLELAATLPGAVPAAQNFAQTAVFQNFLNPKGADQADTLLRKRLAS